VEMHLPADENIQIRSVFFPGGLNVNSDWVFHLEREIMRLENWKNMQEILDAAKVSNGKQRKKWKGSFTQLIIYIKAYIVKQLRESRIKTQGLNVTKSRPRHMTIDEEIK
jgi:hypothetical protein